ncbi:MAG: hypothetical protein RL722_1204 [Pseudomonadota bacterium]
MLRSPFSQVAARLVAQTTAARSSTALAAFVAMVSATLIACGGGGAVGGNGTGANVGNATGTVSGFGSIIVDGVRFDDSQVAASIERSAADSAAGGVRAETKLGQQVVFSFSGDVEGSGVVKSMRIEPRYIGPVANKLAGEFTVLGQRILINNIAANGPVTIVDESSGAVFASGVFVEVHAVDSPLGLIATRVEVLNTQPGLRVSGLVSNYSQVGSADATFVVGGVQVQLPRTGVTVSPSTRDLVNGAYAAVFAAKDGFTAGSPLVASRVRVSTRTEARLDDYVGGVVANLNETAKTFSLGNLTVTNYDTANNTGTSTLANGKQVRVRGVLQSDGVTLRATKYQVREQEELGELHGNVLNLTAVDADTSTFTMRDVLVTKNAQTVLDFTRCGAVNALANDQYVEVKGVPDATGGITARSIKCESASSSGVTGVTVEVEGNVNVVAPGNTATEGSFTLLVNGTDVVTVKYNALTFFLRGLETGLDIKQDTTIKLDVEGIRNVVGTSTEIVATKIKPEKD